METEKQKSPYPLLLLFCLVSLVVLTMLLLYGEGGNIVLDCARVESTLIDCYYSRKIAGLTIERDEIKCLEAAEVEVYQLSGDGGPDTYYRVILLHQGGVYRVYESYNRIRTEPQKIVNQINRFMVESPTQSLQIQFPTPFSTFGCFQTWVLVLLGGAIVYYSIKTYRAKPSKIKFRRGI